MIVCSRRAPMFSVVSFTRVAKRAISCDGIGLEGQLDAFGFQQGDVLLDQRVLRLRQNADEILDRQRIQFDANRKRPCSSGIRSAGLLT